LLLGRNWLPRVCPCPDPFAPRCRDVDGVSRRALRSKSQRMADRAVSC